MTSGPNSVADRLIKRSPALIARWCPWNASGKFGATDFTLRSLSIVPAFESCCAEDISALIFHEDRAGGATCRALRRVASNDCGAAAGCPVENTHRLGR